MALEGRNIVGQAQVYNQTRDAVNEYAKTLQQQQLQREREAKVLTDELSKVKLDGIRQPDIPEFTSKYREAKDLFAKRLAARKPEEKIALDSEFKTKMLELSEIAEDSRALAKGEVEFSKMLLNPNIRDRYLPDAVDRFQRAKALSRKDPNYVRDLTQLEQQVDLSKIMDDLNKVDDTLIKSSQWQRAEQDGMQGNRKGVFVSQMRSINPQQQAVAYGAEFDLNPKFRVAIRQMFPNLADLPNEQLKAVAIPELVKQRARTETDKTQFKENDTSMERMRAQDAMIRARRRDFGDGEAEEGVGEVEVNKELFGDQTKNAKGEPIIDPQRTIKFDYFIKPTKKNFASTQLTNVLNVNTGKNEMMRADTNAALLGLGYTKTKGGALQKKALVVNSDGSEYVVNESDLPIAVRKSEEYKLANSKLDSEYQSRSKSKSTKFTSDQEKLIQQNLKANPAYTREEIIQALGL